MLVSSRVFVSATVRFSLSAAIGRKAEAETEARLDESRVEAVRAGMVMVVCLGGAVGHVGVCGYAGLTQKTVEFVNHTSYAGLCPGSPAGRV